MRAETEPASTPPGKKKTKFRLEKKSASELKALVRDALKRHGFAWIKAIELKARSSTPNWKILHIRGVPPNRSALDEARNHPIVKGLGQRYALKS